MGVQASLLSAWWLSTGKACREILQAECQGPLAAAFLHSRPVLVRLTQAGAQDQREERLALRSCGFEAVPQLGSRICTAEVSPGQEWDWKMEFLRGILVSPTYLRPGAKPGFGLWQMGTLPLTKVEGLWGRSGAYWVAPGWGGAGVWLAGRGLGAAMWKPSSEGPGRGGETWQGSC